jgi:hypothetical protein
MEENYDILIEVLENSVKKNGEIALTNKHLLNILKLVSKQQDDFDEYHGYDPRWG